MWLSRVASVHGVGVQDCGPAIYLVATHRPPPDTPPSINEIIRMVAGFGGFLNRKADGMPGPQTIWIGLQRCKDFVLALEAQAAAREFGCG